MQEKREKYRENIQKVRVEDWEDKGREIGMKVQRLHICRRYYGYVLRLQYRQSMVVCWTVIDAKANTRFKQFRQRPIPSRLPPLLSLTTITFQRNSPLVQHSSPTSGIPEPHADWPFLILWGHLTCLSRIFSDICSLTGQNVTPDSQAWGILLRSRLVNMVICMVQLFV